MGDGSPLAKSRRYARTVWLLAWVSLLTDVASEMLYPIMPVYLAGIGLSVAGIALIEGVAEAVAGVTKSFFGFLGDRIGKPEYLVRTGYGLSAVTKPLMGLFGAPGAILGLRMADRFGKGIRSTPRDAILTQYAAREERGRVFGFHRTMDSIGAALGPLISLLLIIGLGWSDRLHYIFFVAAIPGLLAILLTLRVRSKRTRGDSVVSSRPGLGALLREYLQIFRLSRYSPEYRRLLLGMLLVAVVNSSDIFLLLRAREIISGGVEVGGTVISSAVGVIAIYIFYNVVYAAASSPMGRLADRFGFKPTYLVSLAAFVLAYTLLAQSGSVTVLVVAFAIYGIFAAGNDAVVKAWTTTTLDDKHMGSGLGVESTLQSLTFLGASLTTGLLWTTFDSRVALSASALGMLVPVLYFLSAVPNRRKSAT